MMYVRQARPLGCRGWEAARRRWRRRKRMETVETRGREEGVDAAAGWRGPSRTLCV